MASPDTGMSPDSCTKLKRLEEKKAEKRLQEAIRNIDPEAEKLPDLHDKVVERLKAGGIGRCKNWSDFRPINKFYGWMSSAAEDEKPALDVLLTLLAVHKTLAHTSSDKFLTEVKRRGLDKWAKKQLQAMGAPLMKNERHRPERVKVESAEDQAEETTLKRKLDADILPSIEHDSNRVSTRMNNPRPTLRITPSAGETTKPAGLGKPNAFKYIRSPENAQATVAAPESTPKRQKTQYFPPQRRIANCDESAQTDEAMFHAWVLHNIAKFVSPIKEAFEEVVAGQTEALTKNVPIALQTAIEQAVAAETNRQQNDQIIPRRGPAGPLAALHPRRPQHGDRFQQPARGLGYEERLIQDRRGRANRAPDGELVMDLQGYQYIPEAERRRH